MQSAPLEKFQLDFAPSAGREGLKMLKNYPFWKGQWVCQLSNHRPSAVRVPASAPGHTPQLSCSAQLRPHLSLGCLDAAGGHPGESYLQVQAVLDSPGHLGFQKGQDWPVLAWGVPQAGPRAGSTVGLGVPHLS